MAMLMEPLRPVMWSSTVSGCRFLLLRQRRCFPRTCCSCIEGHPPPWPNVTAEPPRPSVHKPWELTSGGEQQDNSVMVDILAKLRAIERKNLKQNHHRRRYSTSAISDSGAENAESGIAVERWSNKFDMLESFPKPPSTPSMAELTIPEPELRRLQRLGARVSNPIKIGYLGVTRAAVQRIHERWQRNEVLRVKCEGPPAVNMRKTHDELEAKTGGLVIWRTGGMALLYRGKSYFSRYMNMEIARREKLLKKDRDEPLTPEPPEMQVIEKSPVDYGLKQVEPDLEEEYVNEVDALLARIGPRYDDWKGARPVPVDGDLLPAVIRKFKPPLRMLPYRVKPKLTNMELTALRTLARPLPPHFVLGRNRGLQGLAAAVLKLWEKSEIVKIGVKRGVENTRNQMMAEELKCLTGGVILSRDKYFILLYRGKDFLPRSVATVLKEREIATSTLQETEERRRGIEGLKQIEGGSNEKLEDTPGPSSSGSLAESREMKMEWDRKRNVEEEEKSRDASLLTMKVREQRNLEAKLASALTKKRLADREIAKLEMLLKASAPQTDRETITEEERHLFRKMGLRMDAFLLLGRRGVFDGVIENMHLHWKHRELVKLLLKEKDMTVTREVARMLEAESGGILVDIVTTSKGQAIIMYRGKNYQRPAELRPPGLLTKRKALARSKEIQRKEALQLHINKLESLIQKIRRDYESLLTNSSLPESPRTALYKEISEDAADEDFLKLTEDEEDELEAKTREVVEEDSQSSEWDLETADEEDDNKQET